MAERLPDLELCNRDLLLEDRGDQVYIELGHFFTAVDGDDAYEGITNLMVNMLDAAKLRNWLHRWVQRAVEE